MSEQIPTVCALGVLVNPDLTVRKAGGLLLQLLPYCPDSVIDKVEQNISSLPPMTAMLDGGMTVEEIVQKALAGMEFDVLDTYHPEYRCTCSRERVQRAFLTMQPQEVRELPDENGLTEVTCSFCDRVYRFTREDLERLLSQK